jgi:hypothetical protein
VQLRGPAGAAGIQRAAACAGAGFGAAAVLGFGFFGRIGLRTFGGGAAGVSSANTGLGSMKVVGGEPKSPGLRITWTGTVTGWNLGLAKGDREAGVGCRHVAFQIHAINQEVRSEMRPC